MRTCLQRDGEHLLRRRHFKIERFSDLGLQPGDVRVANVAAILAQMRGDAVGSGFDRDPGRPNGIRVLAATCVPERRNVIDIDAEAQMRNVRQMIVPEQVGRSDARDPARQS